MTPVEQFETEGATLVLIAKDQPEYITLPALVFPNGRILTEWSFTEEERLAIAHGENLRLSVWVFPHRCPHCHRVEAGKLQPVALELTDEREG